MCGIVAIVSRNGPICHERVAAATKALEHRGPDGDGHWIAPDARIALGHRRLAVLDLKTGAQPIASEDGQVVVTANGEFYGFEEIRRELEEHGHRFRTQSDSEIVVHLYEEMGERCVERLRGEFAFVLWDEASRKLFAVRDRFGIKPLHYVEHNGELLLASEAKAFFAAGVPALWDMESVFRTLFLCMGDDQSLFNGIRQIPPGHLLTHTEGTTRVRRYWDATYPLADERHADDEATSIERVRSLIEESVRLRMRADVPVGCLLSGGIDSSAVLGFASRYCPRMRAFTIAFDDPRFDESCFARDTAAFVGASFETVDAGQRRLADNFAESVAHGEVIQYNAHGTARYLLSHAVQRAGYKVVLAGEGADELFAGYGFASSAVLSRASRGSLQGKIALLMRLLRPTNQAERAVRATSPWLVRASRVLNLSPQMMDPLAARMTMMQGILSREFTALTTTGDPYRAMFEGLAPMPSIRGREPAKQLIYLWMKSIFPAYVLAADRADMAHGIEVRLPFLDHVLFDYVRRIPVSLLAANGRRKHVLREAASSVLSSAVRDRAKKPLMAPSFTARREDPLNEVVRDILRSQATDSLPFFDRRALSTLVDRRDDGHATADPLLLMAASLAVMQERYRLN
jgi:asparagine synthase (glutamine-hydrolysing)